MRRRTIVSIHKWIGLASVILILIVAFTGLALNHNVDLKLDERRVSSGWLASWYGVAPQGEPVGYTAGEHLIAGWDGQVFFGEKTLGQLEMLMGAGKVDSDYVAVGPGAILVSDGDGNLLEQISGPSLPPGEIEQAGTTNDGTLALKTKLGTFVLIDLIQIEPAGGRKVSWFNATEIQADHRQSLEAAYLGEGLSLYRITLDLHSGRFFGRAGVIVYDVGTILFLFLAITGVWLAVRKSKQKREDT